MQRLAQHLARYARHESVFAMRGPIEHDHDNLATIMRRGVAGHQQACYGARGEKLHILQRVTSPHTRVGETTFTTHELFALPLGVKLQLFHRVTHASTY